MRGIQHTSVRTILAGSTFASLMGLVYPALVQAQSSSGELEEIVVTAQRREESQQRVPVSLTAVSAAAIEERQLTDVMSVAKIAPSMQAKPTFNPMEMTIAIRGVTQLIPSINSDPAVGIYTDGVYNVLNAGSNGSLVDMERIEVLRGPQGTLFGRNTIGGSLNITTARPESEFGGYVQAEYGDYGAWKATGVVNLPIAPDVVETRLAYQHEERDGYGRNFITGNKTSELSTDYVRGSMEVHFNDSWELLASVSYLNGDGTAAPSNLFYFDPTASVVPGLLPPSNVFFPAVDLVRPRPGDLMTNYANRSNPQDGYSSVDNTFDLEQTQLRATLTGQLNDYLTFKSISGYARTEYETSQDVDATPYTFLDLISFPVDVKQWSEELQLLGTAFDAKLQWITGLYYFHNEGSQVSRVLALPALGALFGAPPVYDPAAGAEIDNDSYSVFAQVTYSLTSQLSLTAGARYVRDERSATYHDHTELAATGAYLGCRLASTPDAPDLASCIYSASTDYSYTPWTVGLDFEATDDILVYGKISKGFRSGAYLLTGPPSTRPDPTTGITPAIAAAANAANLAAFEPVDPEELVSYEVGFKSELLGHRLRLNFAMFYSEYSNVQVEEDLAGPCVTCTPISKIQNSGEVEIKGAELEITALLAGITFDLGLGYAEPEYVGGPFEGQPVVNTSDFSGTFNASYPINFTAGELTFVAGYSYRSKMVLFTLAHDLAGADREAMTQDGFGLVDARVSFAFSQMPLTIALFGQNLADKDYKSSGNTFNPPLSFAGGQFGPPRTYGASVRYQF